MTTKLHRLEVGVTPGALRAMDESGREWSFFLGLHLAGIWGEVDEETCRRNAEAVEQGGPILSAYRTLRGRELLVITDAAHALTTIVLAPEHRVFWPDLWRVLP
jgi:hypothetical protein